MRMETKPEQILAYFLRVDEESSLPIEGYFEKIDNTLEAFQRYVNFDRSDGVIQAFNLGEIVVVYHDNGKNLAYPLNRAIIIDNEINDIIAGNMLCVRADGEDFTDIKESDEKYIREHLVAFLSLVVATLSKRW